ncbi:MAG: helix-turn-helix domain-containing protein [Acidobacteria bacterium]|nr:helix-turn-helix domain-containing protein [Acidobacteriota bacterium]
MDEPSPKKPTYLPTPSVPPQLRERYKTILLVLSGQWTVSEAARHLSLSRNHFQTLMHRALTGLIENLEPRPPGRTPRSPEHKRLQIDSQKIQREYRSLKTRVETIDRLLSVASDLLKNGAQPKKNQRRRRDPTQRKTEPARGDDDDLRDRLWQAQSMMQGGLPRALAARVVGISASRLRRLSRRLLAGGPLRLPRRTVPDPASQSRVVEIVRNLKGLPGAASLAHSVPGVSRRQAADLKRNTLTLVEIERKRRCHTVRVVAPGIVRGFDQLVLDSTRGRYCALISADASVPYRTDAFLAHRYDELSVAAAVERDFATNGPPLVWRIDRAKAHDAPSVRRVLERFHVLPLHGPPHHPAYYGQLERQNREHRAWLGQLIADPADLPDALERMIFLLNTHWHRPTLRWMTAEQAWQARPHLHLDRHSFRAEVTRRAVHLEHRLTARGGSADLAERLAIEQELAYRELLVRT